MTGPSDNDLLETYVPVYDVAPEKPDELRGFIVEQFRRMASAINVRTIGFYLDQELLTGKAFIPGVNNVNDGGSSQQFRSILRKVIVFPGLAVGPNSQPHGLNITSNFSLIQLYGAATNAAALTGEPIPNGVDTISYTNTNIIITVAAAYTRAWAVIEYIDEL